MTVVTQGNEERLNIQLTRKKVRKVPTATLRYSNWVLNGQNLRERDNRPLVFKKMA